MTNSTQITINAEQPFANAIGIETPEIFIGDIHGEYDLYVGLLNYLTEKFPTANLTTLGDLIDRGPDSPRSLALAISTAINISADGTGRKARFICGNHEEFLIHALWEISSRNGAEYISSLINTARKTFGKNFTESEFSDAVKNHIAKIAKSTRNGEVMARWPYLYNLIVNGGGWIVSESLHPDFKSDFEAIITQHLTGKAKTDIAEKGLAEWMAGQKAVLRIGNIVAAHAGISHHPKYAENPLSYGTDYPINPESDIDGETGPRWIRKGFVDTEDSFPGYSVVHGHTIDNLHALTLSMEVPYTIQKHAARVCIDSGSFKHKLITAAIFYKGSVRLIYAHA